jgi:hypothetical protein
MDKTHRFHKITIPGFILDDPRLSDGAKILYGKITRLVYKKGRCWASNGYLDPDVSTKTVNRYLKQLEKAGAIIIKDRKRARKIMLGEPETDKIEPETGQKCPQNSTNNILKYNIFKHNTQTEHPGKQRDGGRDENPETREARLERLRWKKPLDMNDSHLVIQWWQECCRFWNSRALKPECRFFFNLSTRYDQDIKKVFRAFSLKDILNAIENYSEHRKTTSADYVPALIYGCIETFLINGVQRYFDDSAFNELFKLKKQEYKK